MQPDFRERLREFYNAYLEGHFGFLLEEAAHDEIEFVTNAPPDVFPYFGRGKGKAALLAAWTASRVDYEFLSYTPLLIAYDGTDTAAVVIKMRAKAKTTNRAIDLMLADFIKFSEGRVIEFRQFMDDTEATEQWLGREIDAR